MSKGLRNIKDQLERESVINRRLNEKKGGLGYLAACDAKGIEPFQKGVKSRNE